MHVPSVDLSLGIRSNTYPNRSFKANTLSKDVAFESKVASSSVKVFSEPMRLLKKAYFNLSGNKKELLSTFEKQSELSDCLETAFEIQKKEKLGSLSEKLFSPKMFELLKSFGEAIKEKKFGLLYKGEKGNYSYRPIFDKDGFTIDRMSVELD